MYTYSVKLIKACICYQKVNIGLPKCLITDTWFSYLDFYSYGKDIDYHVHFRRKNLEITHQKFWKQEKINWNSTYRLSLNSVKKATYHCLKFYWISSKSQFMSQKLLLSVQIVDLMIGYISFFFHVSKLKKREQNYPEIGKKNIKTRLEDKGPWTVKVLIMQSKTFRFFF